MDCTNDHEIAKALHEQYVKTQRETTSYFSRQHYNTVPSQAHENDLLQGKTRQQYHNDNLKAVKVALAAHAEMIAKARSPY